MPGSQDSYKNKTEQQIQTDISERFKQIDKWWIRDDQEIYSASIKVLDSYISELQKDINLKGMIWYFIDLRNNLVKEHNSLWNQESWKLLTKNNKNISELAKKIDDIEEKFLRERAFQEEQKRKQDILDSMKRAKEEKRQNKREYVNSFIGKEVYIAALAHPNWDEFEWTINIFNSNENIEKIYHWFDWPWEVIKKKKIIFSEQQAKYFLNNATIDDGYINGNNYEMWPIGAACIDFFFWPWDDRRNLDEDSLRKIFDIICN